MKRPINFRITQYDINRIRPRRYTPRWAIIGCIAIVVVLLLFGAVKAMGEEPISTTVECPGCGVHLTMVQPWRSER